jgi:N-terminal acetyltransferase B complex non-catalytic subunit
METDLLLVAEQATTCYEKASNKTPNNIELMMGLFNCYVRDYSFLKQQHVCWLSHYNILGFFCNSPFNFLQ